MGVVEDGIRGTHVSSFFFSSSSRWAAALCSSVAIIIWVAAEDQAV